MKRYLFIFVLLCATCHAVTNLYIDLNYTGGANDGTQAHPFISSSSAWSTINTDLAGGPVTVFFSACNPACSAPETTGNQIDLTRRTDTSSNVLTLDGVSEFNSSSNTNVPSWSATGVTLAPCTGEDCAKNASFMTAKRFQITGSTPITGPTAAASCIGYFTIQGFEFANSAGQSGDLTYVHDMTIQYNEFHRTAVGDSTGPGLIVGPAQHGPCNAATSNLGGPDNVTVQYNYIHATWGECLYVGASTSDPPGGPGNAQYIANGMSCGTNCNTGSNYVIQGNTLESCASWGGQGDGSDIKDGHPNLQIIGNTYRTTLACASCGSNPVGNDGQAIPMESGAVIANNWIEQPIHDGIAVFSSWNNGSGRGALQIFNNFIVNVTGGGGHEGGIDQQTPSGGVPLWSSLLIANNSIYNTTDQCIEIESGNSAASVTAKNNIASTCASPGISGGALFAVHDYNDCFAAGSCPSETHGITTDPKFVSTTPPYSDTNFKIQTSSGARNSALNLTSLSITALDSDYFAVARPTGATAWDMGAAQFSAAAVGFSPTSLTFTNQLINTTSAGQTITLTNNSGVGLVMTSVALTTGTQFSIFSNTCTGTIGNGSTCATVIKFTPTSVGAKSDSVVYTDSDASSPQTVGVSGTGIAPAVSLSPSPLAFGNQAINTTSGIQTITLTNTGTATLNITTVVLTTGTQFAKGTDTCASSAVTAGNTCTVNFTFTPTSAGAKSDTVTFTDDATTSPQTDTLTGTGVAGGVNNGVTLQRGTTVLQGVTVVQ